jgi:CRP-like cAMP-binding protein
MIGMGDVGQSRFLNGIGAADLGLILAYASERRVSAGTVLTHQGAPATELFLIARGRARYFTTTPDGDKILLRWLPQGDIFGAAALLAEPSAYRVSTEIVRDASLLVWTRSSIRSLAERCPRIMENALSIVGDYLDWYIAAHLALSSQTARQRLAGVLVSLAPLHGRAVPGGGALDVTNEELASAAHITLFTASRILNEWQRRRAIVKRRGHVVLRAPEQLVIAIDDTDRPRRAV